MSHQTGIKSNERLRQFFAKSKEGGEEVRMFKVLINNESEELELASYKQVRSADWRQDYNEFILDSIEPKQPCFIFYRLDERTATGYVWLFVAWSPDFASVKHKMLYAATKSTLKLEFGAGQIKDELFGTIKEDITLEGYLKHIKSQLAPAPLTNREEELEILKQSEDHTRINVDTKHKTLQGVMFPVDRQASEALNAFKHSQNQYIRLAIDLKTETIVLDGQSSRPISLEQLQSEIPLDHGRFHIYRYHHMFNDESCSPILFIYSMPGFSCPVKERMVYSSTKSELLGYLRKELGLELAKTFEVSERCEMSEQAVMDELHPKKSVDGLKFEKPKGPQSRGPRRVTKATNNE